MKTVIRDATSPQQAPGVGRAFLPDLVGQEWPTYSGARERTYDAMYRIDFNEYKKKVMGCWLGKAVGGTLGGPWEGRSGPLDLTFYNPVPDRMLPNDDLDLQVVWLETLMRRGLPVNRKVLADAWLEHIHMYYDEYGVVSRNLKAKLFPPFSGAFDNGFTAGMGSAIRTEIWACLAPGDPALAARLAREDACQDHADEGVYASVYLATLQSAAFVENDQQKLLDLAQAAIPANCRVARAIAEVRDQFARGNDWKACRAILLENHGVQNWTDVAMNLACVVLGWIYGRGDFDRALCTAVNCGKDADCTGATLGALLGILDPDGIPEKWLKPIGRELVLSPCIVGMHHARNLEEFTVQTAALARKTIEYYRSSVQFTNTPAETASEPRVALPFLKSSSQFDLPVIVNSRESLLSLKPLVVRAYYPPDGVFQPGSKKNLKLHLANPTEIRVAGELRLVAPAGWKVAPESFRLDLPVAGSQDLEVVIHGPSPEAVRSYHNPLDLNFITQGLSWHCVAGLPVTKPWRIAEADEISDWDESGLPMLPSARPSRLVEIPGHYLPLPEKTALLTAEIKIPHSTRIRFVLQAARMITGYHNGRAFLQHDGRMGINAIHRSGFSNADLDLQCGWHRLAVHVGGGKPATLFVGIGTPNTWEWINVLEWRLPTTLA